MIRSCTTKTHQEMNDIHTHTNEKYRNMIWMLANSQMRILYPCGYVCVRRECHVMAIYDMWQCHPRVDPIITMYSQSNTKPNHPWERIVHVDSLSSHSTYMQTHYCPAYHYTTMTNVPLQYMQLKYAFPFNNKYKNNVRYQKYMTGICNGL